MSKQIFFAAFEISQARFNASCFMVVLTGGEVKKGLKESFDKKMPEKIATDKVVFSPSLA